MNISKLSALIPPSGGEEIYVTVHHKTLGRGQLYLTPFDCPCPCDDECGPEGEIVFEPDNGKDIMFLGLIVPCECGSPLCRSFAVSDPNLNPQEFLQKLDQLIMSDAKPAAC
jgi:hypothetical protein